MKIRPSCVRSGAADKQPTQRSLLDAAAGSESQLRVSEYGVGSGGRPRAIWDKWSESFGISHHPGTGGMAEANVISDAPEGKEAHDDCKAKNGDSAQSQHTERSDRDERRAK